MIQYLPLVLQFSGLLCAVAALWLLFGAVIALIVAALLLLALGFYLESRKEQVTSDEQRNRSA